MADGDALVQSYLPSVEGYGERALIWIDGELTHAVRKTPRLDDDDESISAALPIAPAEAALATAALERGRRGGRRGHRCTRASTSRPAPTATRC